MGMLGRTMHDVLLDAAAVSIHPFLSRCPHCRMRWERDAALYRHNFQRTEGASPAGSVAYGEILSPIGLIWIVVGERGLLRVETNVDELELVTDLERSECEADYAPSRVRQAGNQLMEYFAASRREFDLEVDLAPCSPFVRRVLEAVRQVPWGTVRSYGDIARQIGRPGAARAVGAALGVCPASIVIPCQRIIRSDGSPGEYGHLSLGKCGGAIKRALLAVEGVAFGGDSHRVEG